MDRTKACQAPVGLFSRPSAGPRRIYPRGRRCPDNDGVGHRIAAGLRAGLGLLGKPIPMELARLIAALSDPAAYPITAADVEVRQTHLSVVFLVDNYAYKIKKPLVLDFVDCGTLERRRHLCDEEVRLNRRLAPGVYLGAVPVTLDGAVRVEGRGEVVEWAVKMSACPSPPRSASG